MERAAAEDPFLAEALEGYRRFPESDHEQSVSRLRAAVRDRAGRRRVLLSYLGRAAAVAALLAAAVGGVWWLIRDTPASGVAMEQTEASDTLLDRSAEAAPPQGSDNQTAASPQPRPSSPKSTEEKATRLRQPVGPPAEKEETVTTVPPISRQEPVILSEEASALTKRRQVEPPVNAAEATAGGETDNEAAKDGFWTSGNIAEQLEDAEYSQPALTGRLISGQVLSSEGEPLIGANVLVPDADLGTVTDLDGRFQVLVPEGQDQLRVSYVGYGSRRVPLVEGQQELTVRLEAPAVAMDEVVVTRSSRSKISSLAEPRGGFEKLERYIAKKREYPAAARAQGVAGEVRLRFTLDEAGRPDRFEVLQSLGFGCDEEAIRLLREGPRWKPGGGEWIYYSVPFGE